MGMALDIGLGLGLGRNSDGGSGPSDRGRFGGSRDERGRVSLERRAVHLLA